MPLGVSPPILKEDVSDIRNSKVADLIEELTQYSVTVDAVDPHADNEEVHEEYGFSLAPAIGTGYDAVVVAVNHKEYAEQPLSYFRSIMNAHPILVDVKGIYRNLDHEDMYYWCL